MNIYVVNLLFFSFSTFTIALIILFRRWDDLALRWFIFSVFVSVYAIGYAFSYNNDFSYENALKAARIANVSAVFIPLSWLYFIIGFLKKRSKRILWFLLPITLVLAILGSTKFAIPSLTSVKGFVHYVNPGPSLHLQTINFFVVVSYGFCLMVNSYLQERGKTQKREIISLIFATVFGFIGGASQFSVFYLKDKGIDLTPLFCTYPFLMAYVMTRHRVLEIEQIAEAFQREKLATIGLLSASINHEIKNPLYIVKGTLESFVENIKDGNGTKTPLEVAEKSLAQINRISDVIQNLNRFAKTDSNETISAEASISEAVDVVLDLVGYEFSLDRINLKKEIPTDLPKVKIDQRQLEQVLFNLIVNACHAMHQGGELKIVSYPPSYPPPTSGGGKGGGTVTLIIMDTGTGITREHIKHIFEPFHTTKGEKGTGLGLYITKQIIERSGGKISVESKEGKGTTFKLEFMKV